LTAEADVAVLATSQHGLVSRRQLLAGGVPDHVIEYRLQIGRLHQIQRGVYAVGHTPRSPLSRALAAVLACGPGAVLSHRSAAALWGFASPWSGPVDVTAPARHRRRGIVAHVAQVSERECTVKSGIPVTRPVRTLIDLAGVLDDRELTRALAEAQVKRIVRPEALAAALDGAPHAERLGLFLDRPVTRSVLEDAFLALVERYRLPRPEVGRRLAGYEVDMLWPTERVIVELDGRGFHAHTVAFERDRERDAELASLGYRVVRITWRRLHEQPDREAARLVRALRTGR
jgi:very-short-patch-repair endonuclease